MPWLACWQRRPTMPCGTGRVALTLSQTAFKLHGSVEHGETVAQAFAELGRCEEAAELQSKLVAAADRASETAMASELPKQTGQVSKRPAVRCPIVSAVTLAKLVSRRYFRICSAACTRQNRPRAWSR